MSIDISMHRVEVLRVHTHHPNNGNSIRLQISGEDGKILLTLYGLPESTTDLLIAHFADAKTDVSPEVGRD